MKQKKKTGQRRKDSALTLQNIKQLPIRVKASHKSDVRTQFAALCYRLHNGKPEVLLITTRGTQRWIIPKGWPMHDKTPADSAMQEAWEEAGVIGKPSNTCLGIFSYTKFVSPDDGLPCIAMVYPVKVKKLANTFPETGQRRRKWFSLKKAAARVNEPELAAIIKSFDARSLRF